jgi:tRNA pseudouridine13 synthase
MEQEIFITKTPVLGGKVKQRYTDFVVEEVLVDGTICKVERFTKPFEEQQKEKLKVPEKNGEHLLLDLEKINTDTNFAIARITRGLGVSKSRIGYAGLKDKRGVTCQRISIFDPTIEKIERFGMKGIKLRKPAWSDKRIELGDLFGNNFVITIRNLEYGKENLEKIFSEFKIEAKKGLPNFYGTQRFGGKRMITHRVGKLLIQGKVEDAVMLYLTETFEDEHVEMKNARINLAKSNDFSQAIKEFPIQSRNERTMIQHLCMHPKDFAGAFGKIPKKMKYFYTHAYQSWIFNKIIQERIKLFHENWLEPIDGDVFEDGVPTALLPGIETIFAKGKVGEIEKKIMEQEGITFKDFNVGWMSDLSSNGGRKKIALFPKDLKLIEIGKDEFNEGKNYLKMSFFLEKGLYATTVLREFLKQEIY